MTNCMELLKELITVQSIDREGANSLIDYCENWLKRQGVDCQIVHNAGFKSLIAEIGTGEKTLILNGHVDVVSGIVDQFTPYEADGKLYGRGAADMKAGVAAIMTVMVNLKNTPLTHKVQLQLVTDEETGGLNCSRYLVEQGYIGDFVICAEPTQMGLGIQAKGILQMDITVAGRSAHGSRPWEGDNAILRAYDIFNSISKLPFAYEKSSLYDCPSINLAKLQGGDVYNKVPSSCVMSLDIRFLPNQDENEIIRQIESVAGAVMIHAIGTPVKTEVDNDYVLQLARIAEGYMGAPAKVFGQHGSADTRFFAKCNIPAIEFGPSGGNWHGDGEYVEIASIECYIRIVEEFARQFS